MFCSFEFVNTTAHLKNSTDSNQDLIMGQGTPPSPKWRDNTYLKQVYLPGVTLSLNGNYVVKEILNRNQALNSSSDCAISYKTSK